MALDVFWWQLLAKMMASAAIVVVATLTAEKVGAFWGALIASLPVAAGPIYVVLALEHDAAFLAESAIGSLAATAATAAYMLVLALCCPRLPAVLAFVAGIIVWFVTAAVVRMLPWDLAGAAAATTGALLIGMSVTVRERRWSAPRSGPRRWYDIPLRALLVAALVAVVTTFSRTLGPEITGYAAVFPIAMTSLTLIIYLRQGGRAVGAIMAHSFLPMIGFVLALVALSTVAPLAGSGAALAVGLGGSLLWSGVLAIHKLASAKPAMRAAAPRPAAPTIVRGEM